MNFNVNKCRVMHIGKRNLEFQCQMNDGWVKSVDVERDLGVLISKDLKFSKECLLAKNKANLMLGIINRGEVRRNSFVMTMVKRWLKKVERGNVELVLHFSGRIRFTSLKWQMMNYSFAEYLKKVC